MSVPPEYGQQPQWGPPPAGTSWQQQPAGYPPPGYPAPGPPGAYPGGGYGQQPRQPGTNGFAVAALVLGIIGGVLLSVIFGFVALSQIKKSGQNGRGLAITGLVFSGLWTLLIVVIIIVAVATEADRDDTGTIASGGTVQATDLALGDCVNNLQDTTRLLSLPAVPCTRSHEGEVYAVFDLPAGPYPGVSGVSDQVETECNARLGAYSPSAVEDTNVGIFTVYPMQANWAADDREVVCIATAQSGVTTGSIRGR